jgi:para-nitrobenzyl esterase
MAARPYFGSLIAATVALNTAAAAPPTAGFYQGFQLTPSVDAFRGIAYAEQPVGALRYQPANLSAPADAPFDATSFGSACFQTDDPSHPIDEVELPFSESCLFLNVYRPSNITAGARLPVAFWIHGGALETGSGGAHYDGSSLADEGIVVVTINYRLGALGFIPWDESGNGGLNGLLDQITALRWVQANIGSFGGEKNAVTVFGESAGSKSTCMLNVSPLAHGLFSPAKQQLR